MTAEPYALATTYDGLPVSPVPPFGATVVVYRRDRDFLLLHRAHQGPAYEGDWAWTPPAGARLPHEPIHSCAARELKEETGLVGALQPVRVTETDWAIFRLEVPSDVRIVLDGEHDRYEWVSLDEAQRRCMPEVVRAGVSLVAGAI